MAGKNKSRRFECSVVNEVVQIRLRLRRGLGFGGEPYPFIQCDQPDCQYVDENKPPCPLHLEMFSDEIQAQKEKRGQHKGWQEE